MIGKFHSRLYFHTICMVVEVASGMGLVFTTHDLLTQCMCPSFVHACVAIVAALTDSG